MPLDLRAIARDDAKRRGVDPGVFERQIDQESRFDPNAHNDASGADGIAQIVVAAHPSMKGKTRDPVLSLDYAAQYDRSNADRFHGDIVKMLAAYNWGPGRVDNWNGQRSTLPAETRGYLDSILGPDWKAGSGDEQPIGAGGGGGSGSGGGFWAGFFDGMSRGILQPITGGGGPGGGGGASGVPDWADVAWAIAFGAAGVWLIMAGTSALAHATYSSPIMAGPVGVAKAVTAAIPQASATRAIASQLAGSGTVKITTPAPVKAVLGQGTTRPSGALGKAAKAIRNQASSTAADGASGALAAGIIDA